MKKFMRKSKIYNVYLCIYLRLKKSKNKIDIKNHLINNTYETVILEKLIIKTGALLAIGFGEAGSRIIAENMSKGEAVNPLIPGKKIIAIFGFCDIRQFTNITEVLKEDIMVFVNEIAKIVHGEVHRNHGSANKNIGDAFLLVWKIPEHAIEIDEDSNVIVKDSKLLGSFGELALLSFVRIIS